MSSYTQSGQMLNVAHRGFPQAFKAVSSFPKIYLVDDAPVENAKVGFRSVLVASPPL